MHYDTLVTQKVMFLIHHRLRRSDIITNDITFVFFHKIVKVISICIKQTFDILALNTWEIFKGNFNPCPVQLFPQVTCLQSISRHSFICGSHSCSSFLALCMNL